MAKHQKLERVFHFDGTDYPDINPTLPPEKIIELYSATVPAMTTASVGKSEVKKDKLVFNISKTAKTKG